MSPTRRDAEKREAAGRSDDGPYIQWERTTGDDPGLDQVLAWVDRLRAHAGTLGVPIKPGSRVALMEQRLRRFKQPKYDPRRDARFDPMAFAHGVRDVFELSFICDKLIETQRDSLGDVLPELLSGAERPDLDGTNTKARNLQFQYFVAAKLAHSGMPVSAAEPDLLFVPAEVEVAVAAKRVTSEQKVIRRVREAAKQIASHGMRGFVAVCLDYLVPPPGEPPPPWHEKQIDLIATERLQAVLRRQRRVREALAGTAVLGLLASVTVVGFVGAPWKPAHTGADLFLPQPGASVAESAFVKDIVARLKGPTSLKRDDLRRDPRYALHTFPSPQNEDAFYITGIVRPVEDTQTVAALRAQFLAERKWDSAPLEAGRDELFEFVIDRCLHTATTGHGDWNPKNVVWRSSDS